MRIEHSRTIKEGWSYSTTVEMSDIAYGWVEITDAIGRLGSVLTEARRLGEEERDLRNQRDAAAKASVATTELSDHTK